MAFGQEIGYNWVKRVFVMPTRPDLTIFTPTLEGGVGRAINILAGKLSLEGYAVEVVTLHVQRDSIIDTIPKLVDLNKKRAIFALFPFFVYLIRKRPRAVLSMVYHTNLIAIIAKCLPFLSSTVVLCEQVAIQAALNEEVKWKRKLLEFLIPKLYNKADKVVTVSEQAKEELASLGVDVGCVEVIYNFVDPSTIAQASQEVIQEGWLLERNWPVFLTVGRLEPQKDYPTLIQAFAKVRDRSPSKLVIVGDGRERGKLEALVEDLHLSNDVLFLGHKRNPFPYFKLCDVFVLSSKYEGLPLVLVEALFLGCRIVSTSCPSGPKEILQNGKLGTLVEVGNANELSAAMLSALDMNKNITKAQDVEKYSSTFAVKMYKRVLFNE